MDCTPCGRYKCIANGGLGGPQIVLIISNGGWRIEEIFIGIWWNKGKGSSIPMQTGTIGRNFCHNLTLDIVERTRQLSPKITERYHPVLQCSKDIDKGVRYDTYSKLIFTGFNGRWDHDLPVITACTMPRPRPSRLASSLLPKKGAIALIIN